MQIFAPCGLAAAQMTLGLVPLYDGLHLGPKARVLAAQAVLVLPDRGFAHAEYGSRRAHGSTAFHNIPSHRRGAPSGSPFIA